MRKIRNKRILLYMTVLALLVLGGRKTDIGQLRPVEVIKLHEKAGLLFLNTDTGDAGWGLTIDQAVMKLKETTAGEIYLDTADYLVVEEGAEQYLPHMRKYLKKKTKMVYGPDGVDLEEAAAYMRVHRPSGTIGKCPKPVEALSFEGGKLVLKNLQEKQK